MKVEKPKDEKEDDEEPVKVEKKDEKEDDEEPVKVEKKEEEDEKPKQGGGIDDKNIKKIVVTSFF